MEKCSLGLHHHRNLKASMCQPATLPSRLQFRVRTPYRQSRRPWFLDRIWSLDRAILVSKQKYNNFKHPNRLRQTCTYFIIRHQHYFIRFFLKKTSNSLLNLSKIIWRVYVQEHCLVLPLKTNIHYNSKQVSMWLLMKSLYKLSN